MFKFFSITRTRAAFGQKSLFLLSLVFIFLITTQYPGHLNPYSLAHSSKKDNLVNIVDIWPANIPSIIVEDNDTQKKTSIPWTDIDKHFKGQSVWVQANISLKPNTILDQQLVISLGGEFSADVYWNDQHLYSKAYNTQDSFLNDNKTFLTYIPINENIIQEKNNTLLLYLEPNNRSAFMAPTVQVLSVNLVSIHQLDALFYNLLYGFILVGLLFLCIVSFLNIVTKRNAKNDLIIALSGFAFLCNFLLNTLIQPNSQNINIFSITSIILLSIGMSLIIFDINNTKKNKTVVQGLAILTPLLILSFLWVLPQKTPYALLLPFWAFLPSIALFLDKNLQPNTIDRHYIIYNLSIYTLLSVIWPFHMSLYGIYFFILSCYLPTSFQKMYKLGHQQKTNPKHFEIYSSGKRHFFQISDIQFINALGNYTEIVMIDDATHILSKNLKATLATLPEDIIRVHKSHAVHKEKIEIILSFSGSRYQIKLKNGTTVPVGRHYVKTIRNYLS